MAALWLSGFMILLLSANSFGETGNPREFSTCSFSFEKRWEIIDDQDADWQGEKTDFFWGDVEISEAKGEWRVFEHVLSRNDYEDSKAYQATTRERVFSNGTITGSQHTSEGVLASTPGSTKDAVRAHRDLMASNQQAKTYYFDASPAEPFADLWQFHFLGYLPAEGPIWKINSKRVGDDFTFVDLRKNQVRYRLDPVSGLFHSATSINSGIRLDMTHVEQVGQTDLYITKTQGVSPPIYSDVQELRIQDLKFDKNLRIKWSSAPKNGTRIGNLKASQIKYAWHDGKPVKVLDRSVENVEFMRLPRRRRSIMVVTTIGILCVAFYFFRRRTNS